MATDPFAFTPITDAPAPIAPTPSAVQPLPGGTPGEPAPVATSSTLPASTPAASPLAFSPVDSTAPQEYIPAAVRNGMFPQQDMAALKAMPSDQAFDTAVRLNAGDVRWPLEQFKGISPDVVADVQRLAQNHGTTFDVAHVGKDELQNIDKANAIMTQLSATDTNGKLIYPATNAWLKDPTKMAMAHDDAAALASIEDVVKNRQQAGEWDTHQNLRYLYSSMTGGLSTIASWPGAGLAFLRNVSQSLSDSMRQDVLSNLQNTPSNPHAGSHSGVAPLERMPVVPDYINNLGTVVPGLDKEAEATKPVTFDGHDVTGDLKAGHIVGAGMQVTGNAISAAPEIAAGITDPLIGVLMIGASAQGATYQRDLKAGKSQADAANDGAISFAANTVIGRLIGHAAILQDAQKTLSTLPPNQSLMSLAGQLFKKTVTSGTKGAVAQTAIQATTDAGDYATGNKHAFDNESENLANAALIGFGTDSSLTVPMGAVDGYMRIRQAQNGIDQNAALMTATNASKMVTRDPNALAEHITASAEAAGTPTTIGVDGEKLTTFFQGNNEGLANFASDMGTTPEAITQAAQTGSEVSLPLGPYQAKYAGKSDVDAAINQDLRFTPGGLSANELPAEIARVQAMADAITGELGKTANGEGSKLPDQVATMRDTMMRSKAEGGVGYSSDEADSQIAVMMAGLGNLASQRGENVEQTINRLGLGLNIGDIEHDTNGVHVATSTSPRGAISFAPAKTVIHLARTTDMSTFLHETGHLLFHEMSGMVEQGIANDQTKADLQTLHDFAEVKDGGKLDTLGEEKIIKAFEGYLREGKAPSIELSGPFARIRSWLTSVYRSIASLGVEATDPVRQVFDRLLASNEDIADAQEYYSRKSDVLDLIKADDAAKEKVRAKLATVQRTALDKQTSAYLKSYLKAVGGVAAVREAAKREVEDQPVYKAIEAAKDGKIDEASIESVLGKSGLADFKARYPSLVKKNGDHSLESLAAEFGFESPESLADNLSGAVPKNEAIKNYTQRLVAAKEQELRDEIIKRGATPADAAMHTNASLSYLIAETQLMAKQLEGKGRPAIRMDEHVYRDAAKQAIANMPVKRAGRHDLFAKAEARLSRQVLEFAKKGDWEKALEARQKQMAQHAMVQEAIFARDERQAIERRYGKTKLETKLKNVENSFVDPVREILVAYGLTDIGPKSPFDLRSLAVDDSTLFSLLPSWIVNQENVGDYRNLKFSQLQDVDNAVKAIMSYGSDEMKSLKANEERTTAEWREASIARMSKLKDAPTPQRDGSFFAYPILKTWDWLKAQNAQTAFTARIADNFELEGPAMRLYNRMKSAEMSQSALSEKTLHATKDAWTKLTAAADRIHHEYGGKKFFLIPELPLPDSMRLLGRANWNAEMLISYMLNTGNAGNKSALHNAYGFDDAGTAKVASHFKADELKAIQKIWDETNTLFEPLNKTHLDVYNREITKVEAEKATYQSKDGEPVTLEGGYYPLVFDHELNDRTGAQNEQDLMANKLQAVFRSSKPEDGFTQGRVAGHSLPPSLSLDVWAGHINDTSRYIHYAAVVRDWNRVTKDPLWKASFIQKFGTNQYKTLRDWLQYQAVPKRNQTSEFMRAVDSVADWTRSRTTTAVLGLKFSTAVLQRTALINSAVELGGWKWIGEGYKFLGTKGMGTSTLGLTNTEGWKQLTAKSRFMATREDNIERNIRDAVDKMAFTATKFTLPGTGKTISMQDVREIAFHWLVMNDRATCAPVWAGAYQKFQMTMADVADSHEANDAKAVAYADQVIQNTQPTSLKAELNVMQRTEGWVRFATSFMTWSFKFGNRLLYQNKAWTEGKVTTSAYASHLIHEVMAEPWLRLLIGSAIGGSVPAWYQYPLATVNSFLQWIPGISNITSMAQWGFNTDAILPGAAEPLRRLNNVRGDVIKKDFDPVEFAWDLGRVTEFLLGVPALNVVKDIVNTGAAIAGEKQKPLK